MTQRPMTVINLYGGPGSGKSTTAAGLFNLMKVQGHNVELVTEFAKDLTWEKNRTALDNQLLILAQQDRRLFNLEGQVDYVITDSPLLLGLAYAGSRFSHPWFVGTVLGAYRQYDNKAFFLKRPDAYSNTGRNEGSKCEAESLDHKIANILDAALEDYRTIVTVDDAPRRIYDIVIGGQW